MAYLRFIGDVHGFAKKYLELIPQAEFSIQLGDLSYEYSFLNHVDSSKHKVLAGNHDNYTSENGIFIHQTPHFLGDFGKLEIPFLSSIFFVRGARSIDASQRPCWIDYWKEEELSYAQGMQALDFYEKENPKIVISHECPESIIDYISRGKTWNGELIRPSSTANLLQNMLEIHEPDLWVFGHHHINFDQKINNTRFVCVDILDVFDIEKNEI